MFFKTLIGYNLTYNIFYKKKYFFLIIGNKNGRKSKNFGMILPTLCKTIYCSFVFALTLKNETLLKCFSFLSLMGFDLVSTIYYLNNSKN